MTFMGATGYFTHPDCLKHEMGPGHPECPERLGAIEDRLLISGVDMALTRRHAAPAGTRGPCRHAARLTRGCQDGVDRPARRCALR